MVNGWGHFDLTLKQLPGWLPNFHLALWLMLLLLKIPPNSVCVCMCVCVGG